jgi:CRISPR-associated protein Cas5h
MNILKFNLSGKTAFFKKPDVNSNCYFTYGQIHKVALMGIFGAIMGYGGYNQQVRNSNLIYPEFYERLRDIKVSIVPEQVVLKSEQDKYVPSRNKIQKGYFNKKVQVFNNTVGYANTDGNMIVREQWLESPCWDIYLMLQSDLEHEIAKRILGSKATFIPYLGKNDHMATISNAEILHFEKISLTQELRIDSLYSKECFKACQNEDLNDLLDPEEDVELKFKYEERLPIALEESTNQYITKPFIYTNGKVVINDAADMNSIMIGKCNKIIIQFY